MSAMLAFGAFFLTANHALVRAVLFKWSLIWVSRTALLPARATVQRGWLDNSSHEVDVVDTNGTESDAETKVHVGWGNNAIVGFDSASAISTDPVVLGMLDAQYLWLDLESLSTTSSEVVHDVAEAEKSSRSGGLNAKLRIIESLSNALAIHNLEYDDLLMHIQGARRAVGVALLTSWNYDDVAGRISRRLEDTARILEQNKARQDRRYQGLVEAILFGLALAAVLELVLVAITAAIDLHDSGLHRDSPFGIFRWLQETNPDVLIVGTLVGIVITIVIVGVARLSRR